MYKDKDKQREANRQAKQRQRAKHTAGIKALEKEYDSKGMTSESMTELGMTEMDEPKCITIDDQAESIMSEAILKSVLESQKTNHSPSFEEICQSNEGFEESQGAGLKKGLTPQGGTRCL